MKSTFFGIEVELTGITREKAARTIADYLSGTVYHEGGNYDTYKVTAPDGRVWKIVYDASIRAERKENRQSVPANDSYKVELVSPILTYDADIETLQELVRRLRRAGGFTNPTVGCHIHLDNAGHTPRSVRNFINIIASKNDLLYKALRIEPERMKYCKKMDAALIEKMNTRKPKTMQEIERIWYEGYTGSIYNHYHSSRYAVLNLHSMFNGAHHTIEMRAFNSGTKDGKLHAGLIRSYIVLALALNHQALTQKSASSKKNQVENEKFAMRTYLNRLGLIGDEYKSCREHLTAALDGDAAWRFGRPE